MTHLKGSLFDRLEKPEDLTRIQSKTGRRISLDQLKGMVIREVSWLINTRRSGGGYGGPDFVDQHPDNEEKLKLMLANLEHTIAQYEPRLKNVRVKLKSQISGTAYSNRQIQIQADLHYETIEAPVEFGVAI